MNTNITKTELFLFVGVMLCYMFSITSFSTALLAGVFAPYFILRFVTVNGNKPLPYVVMFGLIVAGAFSKSHYLSAYFVLAAIVPALTVYFLHKIKYSENKDNLIGELSPLAIMLSPLPITLVVSGLLYFMPETRESVQNLIIKSIEEFYNSMKISDIERLESANQIVPYYNNREMVATYMVTMAPSLIYTSILTIIYFTEKLFYSVSHNVIVRTPDLLLWVIVLGGGLVVMPEINGMEYLSAPISIIGSNVLIIAGMIYFCRGFDIVRYNMFRFRIFLPLRIFIFFMLITSRVLVISTAILGLVSVYIDLTRSTKKEKDTKNDGK